MTKLKTPDMSAFVGRDFDCEKVDIHSGKYHVIHKDFLKKALKPNHSYMQPRPRLNKAQVLESYGWLPDGFVWEVKFDRFIDYAPSIPYCLNKTSDQAREVDVSWDCSITWIKCLGLQQGYQLRGCEVIINASIHSENKLNGCKVVEL